MVKHLPLCETVPYTSTPPTLRNTHVINPQDPDTLLHCLDARFALLSTSMQLAFWQEVFHSTGCPQSAEKAPLPTMMSKYHENLGRFLGSMQVVWQTCGSSSHARSLHQSRGRGVREGCGAYVIILARALTWTACWRMQYMVCVYFIGEWTR